MKIRHYVRIVRRNHRGSGLEGFDAHTWNTSKNLSTSLSTRRCREENRPRVELEPKAWEPALHTRARQEAYKDEVGTCEDQGGWIW